MNNITEMMMETYLSESLCLRIEKLSAMKNDVSVYRDILDVNIFDTAGKVRKSAYDAFCSIAVPENSDRLLKAVNTLTRVGAVNVKEARRRIADILIADNSYKF